MTDLLQRSLGVLREAYAPHGFNTGMNLGRSAGAGVVDHFHLHVVPRWTGDSNFMPIVGGTKVLSKDLDATCARLRPLFAGRAPGRPAADTNPLKRFIMLKTMRQNMKSLKLVLWFIVAAFIVSIFVIWGGSGRMGEGEAGGDRSPPSAATRSRPTTS